MKLFSYPAGAKVGGQEISERTVLPAQAFEINETQHGVEVLALWTTEQLAEIGVKPVVEDPVEVDHAPGEPVDVDDGALVRRTFPNAVFSQELYDARCRSEVLAQISALEAQQTPRRIREAALTEQGRAWLEALDQQIATLRGQL